MSISIKFLPVFHCGLSLLVWMGVIFFFSSLSGNGYSDTTLLYFVERKGAHVIEYAILMLLAVRFATAVFPRETFKRILFLAAVFSITYGASDEFHQFFVPYRGAKISDVFIDGLGALLMGAFLWSIAHTRRRKKRIPC